jgi:hypothetical protein
MKCIIHHYKNMFERDTNDYHIQLDLVQMNTSVHILFKFNYGTTQLIFDKSTTRNNWDLYKNKQLCVHEMVIMN